MNILVLYTRLTGYWMAAMRNDVKTKENNYLVIRKKPSSQAPFKISSEVGIEIIDGDDLTTKEIEKIATKFKPDLLYVAGWRDKRYLYVALKYKQKGIQTITGLDNQWTGSIRQKIGSFLGKWRVLKYFTHIWVAGRSQYYFAKKIGFRDKNILTGLYCADETIFKNIKQIKHNKQLIFIGRLVEHKGLKVFFSVLNELITSKKLDIKIQIIGNGPLASLIPKHANITHTPFVNPEKIPALLKDAGTFILPSLYEAWGVVLHEAVLAGLPVLSTHQTGAASTFLIHGYNGYVYDAFNKEELKTYIDKVTQLDDKKYFEMSNNSKLISNQVNLSRWSALLNSLEKKTK